MEEKKCDYCGKVIDGYYPEEQVAFERPQSHSLWISGIKKNLKLSIEYVDSTPQPTEFLFCSLRCLKNYLNKDGADSMFNF